MSQTYEFAVYAAFCNSDRREAKLSISEYQVVAVSMLGWCRLGQIVKSQKLRRRPLQEENNKGVGVAKSEDADADAEDLVAERARVSE